MDILTKNSGYSIIEVLVSIVILGIVASFSTSVVINLTTNSKLVFANEALTLASKEIDAVMANHIFTDTSYVNKNSNLQIDRYIIEDLKFLRVNVSVTYLPQNKNILKFGVIKRR